MKALRKLFGKDPLPTATLEPIDELDRLDNDDVIELESQPRHGYQQSSMRLISVEDIPRKAPRSSARPPEPTPAAQTASAQPSAPPSPRASAPAAEPPARTRPQPEAPLTVGPYEPAPKRGPEMVPIESADQDDFARTVLVEAAGQMLGDMLRARSLLTSAQVEAVLAHQERHRTRFGESAIALGYVKSSDVLFALSQQFGYDYAPTTSPAEAAAFSDDLVVAKHPFSQAAEVIRDLRSELLQTVLNPDAVGHPALALVSPDSGDGKTWFAANLAVSLSQLGARTLLIDANLRTPRLHSVFGVDEPKTGLSGILSRHHRAEVMRPVRALPHLYLLPAGVVPPNPLEILQGRGFGELMLRLRAKFTHVIVDTPPLSRGADARVVAARCGASVLVARRHHSSLPVLQQAARHLGKGDAQFAGVVINDI